VNLKHVDATINITKFGLKSITTRYGGNFGRGNGINNSLVIVDVAIFNVLNNYALSVGSSNIMPCK
jgi:hypothetical protein